MKRPLLFRCIFIFIILYGYSFSAFSQVWYARYAAALAWQPFALLKLEVTPEIHLRHFQEPAEWMVDAGLEYQVFSFLELGGSARLNNELKQDGSLYTMRYSLDAVLEGEVNRVEADLRLRFSNYAEYEEDVSLNQAFRTRFKVGYNIPDWKADPEVFIEYFFNPEDYSPTKIRFGGQFDWNLPSRNRLKIGYFYQYYTAKAKFLNVLDVTWGYRFK
ncbi:MAG: DUF2490 domain-containing protein [Bacteroidia bacterium]|nr:DUF2490 domain-containing protein [Bacteroidales bacterium]NCD41405.1 DUF2490 domain-containing protein [Bacteroidia bacterium]HPE87461.1 DUF2490 domain-containing protein [Bacteroidales bacterium]